MDRRQFVLTCAAVPLMSACVRAHFVSGRLDGGHVVVPRSALRSDGRSPASAMVETPSLTYPIFVHEIAPGEFAAVLTRCMHRGCTVEPADGHLVCPCHGSEYSNVGEVLKGPTEKPLIRFAVRTDADNLYILNVGNAVPGDDK